ncbi:hypothetical protein ARMGADRAFT_1086902 [Armillaria gallica]|uniref:Uncharacterized protein n=1 Tax=Armillaria gallica TaxID=47427 RepID=A0A2H3DAR1_ARMGA|nr:hypothetical protein ARMGADRAFT_1086902 [Armillaria gallica]
MEDQLHNVAARVANNARTDSVKLFEFQAQSRLATSNYGESSPTIIKGEEVTLSLQTPGPQALESEAIDESHPVPDRSHSRSSLPINEASEQVLTPQYRKTIKDRVILQCWRAHDLADTGWMEIADQGIFIDTDSNAYIIKGGIADTKGRDMPPSAPKPMESGDRTIPIPMPQVGRIDACTTQPKHDTNIMNNSGCSNTRTVLPARGGPPPSGPPSGGPPSGGPPNGGPHGSGPSRRGSHLP